MSAVAVSELNVAAVKSVGLFCEAAPDLKIDYPEHCVILGWDADDKGRRLALQQELASIAGPVKWAPSPSRPTDSSNGNL